MISMNYGKMLRITTIRGKRSMSGFALHNLILNRMNLCMNLCNLQNKMIDLSKVNTELLTLNINGFRIKADAPINPVARNILRKRIKMLFSRTNKKDIKNNIEVYNVLIKKYETTIKKIAFIDKGESVFDMLPQLIEGRIKEKVLDHVFFWLITATRYVETEDTIPDHAEYREIAKKIFNQLRETLESEESI